MVSRENQRNALFLDIPQWSKRAGVEQVKVSEFLNFSWRNLSHSYKIQSVVELSIDSIHLLRNSLIVCTGLGRFSAMVPIAIILSTTTTIAGCSVSVHEYQGIVFSRTGRFPPLYKGAYRTNAVVVSVLYQNVNLTRSA